MTKQQTKFSKNFKEAYPSLSSNAIDRAQRIKNNYKYFKINNTCRSVIVRFTSFKHRTSFYRNRSKMKGVRIKHDLEVQCFEEC